jgi:phosphoadenosine phosphosulfate reductase
MLTELAIRNIARAFEEATPQAILAWAVDVFRGRLALACSFGGPSGLVLLDMAMEIDKSIPVYYLDTGLLFPETYEHIGVIAQRYGITPRAVHPAQTLEEQAQEYGPALWERDPDRCCNLRKVQPQRAFLKNFDAWISGVRRDQSTTRRALDIVGWDRKFDLVKINPLAGWTEEMVWTYIRVHDIPYNTLHDRGYPSIGCVTCTQAVNPGEDARAGRWRGFAKTECGLHK